MGKQVEFEPLGAAIEEFFATFEGAWAVKTVTKYRSELRQFVSWLCAEKRENTTQSLDYPTLLAYTAHLKATPVYRGIWRGDPDAVAKAIAAGKAGTVRSLNTVNSSMRAIQSFTNWLFHDGWIRIDPYRTIERRGKRLNPLLPREETPTRGADLSDFAALERGCEGSAPLDLRDQAIVAVLKTTAARNGVVARLRIEDVDREHNVMTLRLGKDRKTYQVALLPEAKAAIVRYLLRGRPLLLGRYPVRGYEDVVLGGEASIDQGYLFVARDNGRGNRGGPLTVNGLSDMIDRRYHAGGGTLPSFRSHRIRHGTATILANNGMPIDELAQQMGHSSTDCTKRYAQETPATLGSYVERAMIAGGLTKPARRRAA